MNQKDILKWGLLALGAYLIYRYIEDHGGISNMLGTSTAPGTGSGAGTTTTTTTQTQTGGGSGSGSTTTQTQQTTPPVVDMAGLSVVPDINNSLTGTIKINGVPTKLSIITGDGRIFDATGTDITTQLQTEGVDVVAIRTAFANAAPATTTSSTNLTKCVQPNFFNPAGVCVDAFSGQPVPNTMSQAQQSAGVSGLGAFRVTPPWLM